MSYPQKIINPNADEPPAFKQLVRVMDDMCHEFSGLNKLALCVRLCEDDWAAALVLHQLLHIAQTHHHAHWHTRETPGASARTCFELSTQHENAYYHGKHTRKILRTLSEDLGFITFYPVRLRGVNARSVTFNYKKIGTCLQELQATLTLEASGGVTILTQQSRLRPQTLHLTGLWCAYSGALDTLIKHDPAGAIGLVKRRASNTISMDEFVRELQTHSSGLVSPLEPSVLDWCLPADRDAYTRRRVNETLQVFARIDVRKTQELLWMGGPGDDNRVVEDNKSGRLQLQLLQAVGVCLQVFRGLDEGLASYKGLHDVLNRFDDCWSSAMSAITQHMPTTSDLSRVVGQTLQSQYVFLGWAEYQLVHRHVTLRKLLESSVMRNTDYAGVPPVLKLCVLKEMFPQAEHAQTLHKYMGIRGSSHVSALDQVRSFSEDELSVYAALYPRGLAALLHEVTHVDQESAARST